MSKLRFLTFLSAILLLVWGMSCQSPSGVDKSSGNNSSITPSNNAGMGTLKLSITDGPIDDMEKILVMMTEIRVHPVNEQESNGFVSIWSLPAGKEIDILKLKTDPFDFQASVPVGNYNQIRIALKDPGKIVLKNDPTEYPLSVPSDEIKIPVQFEVLNGSFTTIVLDISAENSLHVVQKGKKAEYLLRPVINVVKQTTTAGS